VKSRLGEEANIIKVDVDKNQDASIKYGIRSVPTLILFKNGKEVWKQSGVVPAESLIQVIRLNS
jgi:thioredoxin 1